MVDKVLINRLEKLSALKLDEGQKDEMISDFNDILNFVEILKSVDTDSINIKHNSFTPLRDDVINNSNIINDVLKHAPSKEDTFFKVPKIIE